MHMTDINARLLSSIFKHNINRVPITFVKSSMLLRAYLQELLQNSIRSPIANVFLKLRNNNLILTF